MSFVFQRSRYITLHRCDDNVKPKAGVEPRKTAAGHRNVEQHQHQRYARYQTEVCRKRKHHWPRCRCRLPSRLGMLQAVCSFNRYRRTMQSFATCCCVVAMWILTTAAPQSARWCTVWRLLRVTRHSKSTSLAFLDPLIS